MTTNKILTKPNFFVKNKNSIKTILFSGCIIAIMLIILSNPKRYNKSVLDGISLFATCVLPGLFPFMILTRLLTSLGAITKLSKKLEKPTRALFGTSGIASYVFLMSALSGYPIGAKIISDLYSKKIISTEDAKKMSVFCTTSGPIFVIGTIGAIMFGSVQIGIVIYASHILASIMSGIILRTRAKNTNVDTLLAPPNHTDNIIGDTITDSVQSILIVGAYITIFFLLADLLLQTGLINTLVVPIDALFSMFGLKGVAKGFLCGILEVTRGAKMLSAVPNIWTISICSALVSFSGISIIMQSMNFLSKCKIKARYFVFAKCVHAILTFVICICLSKLFIS